MESGIIAQAPDNIRKRMSCPGSCPFKLSSAVLARQAGANAGAESE